MSKNPVIVGADLSEPSYEAIRQGHDWARRRNAPLVLCHVMPRHIGTDGMLRQRVDDAIGESVFEARVAEIVRNLGSELTGRSRDQFEVAITEGAPDAELVAEARRRDAGLLVVGSHGRSGLGRIFLGSVAEAVVRDAPVPVLVARPHPRTGRILVGTDFSRPARMALELAAEEARLRGGRVTLVTTIQQHMHTVLQMTGFGSGAQFVEDEYADERKKAKQRLAEELEDVGAQGEVLVTDHSPAADLVKIAEQVDADLVVVGAVGKGALDKFRIGRVAVKVTRHTPCAVLVVRG